MGPLDIHCCIVCIYQPWIDLFLSRTFSKFIPKFGDATKSGEWFPNTFTSESPFQTNGQILSFLFRFFMEQNDLKRYSHSNLWIGWIVDQNLSSLLTLKQDEHNSSTAYSLNTWKSTEIIFIFFFQFIASFSIVFNSFLFIIIKKTNGWMYKHLCTVYTNSKTVFISDMWLWM